MIFLKKLFILIFFLYGMGISASEADIVEISIKGQSPQERAINFLKKNGKDLGVNLADSNYRVEIDYSEYIDVTDRYQTYLLIFYKNIPFDNRIVIGEDSSGIISYFFGYIPPVEDKYTRPTVDMKRAILNARSYIHKKSSAYHTINVKSSKLVLRNDMAYSNNKLTSKTKAEWRIQYNDNGIIYVDAITGQVTIWDSGRRI
ncbi:MAG: hypothetical protein R3F02_16715 [Thiolinea sp.]